MGAVLEKIVVGVNAANCYILGCVDTGEAVIIDPGDEFAKIHSRIRESGLKPKIVINTHGHIDHIGANEKFKLPVYIHRLDADFLTSPSKNLSLFLGKLKKFSLPAKLLEHGDRIEVGRLKLEVIHTPGHTPGGISIKYAESVFTGDTLFCGGVGRTDFSYSSERDLIEAIEKRLFALPGETIIYPGHGPDSTIAKERRKWKS